MTRPNATLVSGALFAALWAGMWFYSARSGLRGSGGQVSYDPLFFPNMLIIVGAVLSLAVLAQGWRQAAARAEPPAGEPQDMRKALVLIALVGVYFAALTFLGFILPSVVFVVIFGAYLGYRNWPVLAATAVLGTFAIWFVFTRWLKAPLPALPDLF